MAGRRVMSEDLKNIEFETSEDVDVTPTFDNMGLREDLLRGIYAYGKHGKMVECYTRRSPSTNSKRDYFHNK